MNDSSPDSKSTGDRSARQVESVPTEVTSAEAKLVYLYVRQTGACTAEELARSLRLTKLSLFPTLRTLVERGLLRRESGRYIPAGRPAKAAESVGSTNRD